MYTQAKACANPLPVLFNWHTHLSVVSISMSLFSDSITVFLRKIWIRFDVDFFSNKSSVRFDTDFL